MRPFKYVATIKAYHYTDCGYVDDEGYELYFQHSAGEASVSSASLAALLKRAKELGITWYPKSNVPGCLYVGGYD